jgi:hypothetical protein
VKKKRVILCATPRVQKNVLLQKIRTESDPASAAQVGWVEHATNNCAQDATASVQTVSACAVKVYKVSKIIMVRTVLLSTV